MNSLGVIKTFMGAIYEHIKAFLTSPVCEAGNKKSDTYYSLTPISNVDLGEYENALLNALQVKEIKNIAVTGPYGSGKSSILKTFEKKYDRKSGYRFLNISLATFEVESQKLTSDEKIKLNTDVEKSLLQQIFFKVAGDELEDSHFSRLKIKRYQKIPLLNKSFLITDLWGAFFLTVFMLSVVFVLKPKHSFFLNNFLFHEEYLFLFKFFAVVSALALVQKIFNTLPKIGLSKLGAAGAEISFNEKKGDSILNKFIDELIYFFVKTDYNILVFEDLDRFPSKDIFIKLREINTLLNYSDDLLSKNKIIKFVFVLGDDIFQKTDDRTKFFDFIIPVIPVINSFNAEEKLRVAINKASENHTIDKGFFEDIALFINDMRTLLNISNEFSVYKRMLDSAGKTELEASDKLRLDDTKLLSLIIYKNKFPEDFKNLNYRKGMIWEIFNNKNKLLKEYENELKNQIEELKKQIKILDEEKNTTFEELKLTYVAGYFQEIPGALQINFNGAIFSFNQLTDEDVFNQLIVQNTINYSIQGGRFLSLSKSFSEIEKTINPNFTYQQRKEIISSRSTKRIDEIKGEIDTLDTLLSISSTLKIPDLLTTFPDKNLFAFTAVKPIDSTAELIDLGLIRFLVVNGFIEEDYDSYMSYFYPGELTANDKQFLISLANQVPLGNKYKLDSVDKITARTKIERFKTKAVLNISLLSYLLSSSKESIKLNEFLKVIVQNRIIGFEFMNSFFVKRGNSEQELESQENKTLINSLVSINKHYWLDFFEYSFDSLSDGKVLLTFLNEIEINNLALINIDDYFTNFLSTNSAMFGYMEKIDSKRVENIIKILNIKFRDLSSYTNKDILFIIDKLSAYDLSKINVMAILNSYGKTNTDGGYDSISAYPSSNLKQYVDNNLNYYVQNTLLNIQRESVEEISTKSLLNSNIDVELKVSIIKKFSFRISEIDEVSDTEIWQELFEFDRIDVNWKNVIGYYAFVGEQIDENLISFFNVLDNSANLARTKLSLDDKLVNSICRKIIYCNEINESCYVLLIQSIPYCYANLSDIKLTSEKVRNLLYLNIFQLTNSNFDFLKNELPESSYLLVEKNITNYLKDTSLAALDAIDYISLINSKSVKSTTKFELIKTISESTYDSDNSLTNIASRFVIENTNAKIFTSAQIEKFLEKEIDFNLKVRLFNLYSSEFELSKINKILSKIDFFNVLTENKRPKLLKSVEILKMVAFLTINNFVNYKEDKDYLKITPKSKILIK